MTRYLQQQLMRHAEERDEPTGRSRFAFSVGRSPKAFCVHAEMFTIAERRFGHLFAGVTLLRIKTRQRNYVLFELPEKKMAHAMYTELRLLSKSERRRHRVASAKGFHLKDHYRVLWEIQRGRCYYSGALLGERFEDQEFSIDHIRPLVPRPDSDGIPGTNWPTNLALVTKWVNGAKCCDHVERFLRDARRFKWFVPTSYSERCRVDRERRTAFRDFMMTHSPEDEWEW